MSSDTILKDGKGSKPPQNGGDVDGGDDAAKTSSKSNKKIKPNNQLMVDHTYTDYSIINEEDDVKILEEESPQLPKPCSSKEAEVREKLKGMTCAYGPLRKNAGGVTQPFPGKLMEVLGRSDLAEIIEWMPHGRAFLVKQPKAFASQVLPRFFKQSKYLSFTRQLNLWGFKRITRGKDMGAYYHEIFLRGRPHLAMRMKRQKIKGTGMKLTPNPDSEPDFYNDYPMMPQLEQAQGGPLPPLPVERMGERMGMLHQAGAADVSSENLLKALKVASSHQEQKMPPTGLTHPQLQQIHQQHQQHQQLVGAVGGGRMAGANPDYQRLLGAMNAAVGVNSIFSPETLHQFQQQQQIFQQQQQQQQHQQQQQQLQQAGNNGTGTANGGYQNLYGALNHQVGINPMLAAASQLPPMIPSAMLQSGIMPSASHLAAHPGSHIAKRAYHDVLLAPGVRKQLGLSASGLKSSTNNGSIGVSFSANYGMKEKLSAVMFRLNNGGMNPGLFNVPALLQPNPADLIRTTSSQSSQAKDDVDDPTTKITAAAVAAAPATTKEAAATKKSKSTTPPPEQEEEDDVFTGYGNDPLQDALKKGGNDPLQDALQKVHKLDDDAASLQRAKAKILQSMTQSGVDPADIIDEEEKKNGGDSPNLDEKRPEKLPSLGRPFPRKSED
jgi:hypothetical protein